MCMLFGHHWYNDINYVRGRKYAYYSRFNNEFEIYNDFVAHERPEHESQQAVVDFLMARWRNPLSCAEATSAAKNWIETTKSDGQHWASWIPPSLILASKPKAGLKQPHYQATSTDFWIPQPKSRLLNLPAEILDIIITYTITPSHAPPLHPQNRLEGTLIPSLSPPLSLTCRQLSTHTLPLYLRENTFIVYLDTYHSLRLAQKWISRFIGDRYVRLVQNIVVLGFIADRTRGYTRFVPVRIGISLRSLEFKVDIEEVVLKEEWKRDFEIVMEELRVACGGYAVGEALLRQLLGIFARECVDTGTGRRIDWYA